VIIRLSAIALLLFASQLLADAQPVGRASSLFAIIYSPGPAWIKDKPIYEQPLREHARYMQKLLDENKLVLAGPFADSSGGMAIIRAANWRQAQAILDDDPAIKSNVFTATLRPWQVVFATDAVPLLPNQLPVIQMQLGSKSFTLEVAVTEDEQSHGLMYRSSMPATHGMIFVFPDERPISIWMKNTSIPLDLIFLSSAGKIVSIHSLKAFDITPVPSESPAKYGIELNQGAAAAAGIKKGDTLPIPPTLEKLPGHK
jgi:uncharacterized protein